MGRADAPFLSCGGATTRVGVVRNLTPNEYYAVRDAHAPHADALPRELDTRPKSPPSLSPTGVRSCLATLSPRLPKNRDPVFIQSHKKRDMPSGKILFFRPRKTRDAPGKSKKRSSGGAAPCLERPRRGRRGATCGVFSAGEPRCGARAEKPGRRRHQGRVRAGAEMRKGGRFYAPRWETAGESRVRRPRMRTPTTRPRARATRRR